MHLEITCKVYLRELLDKDSAKEDRFPNAASTTHTTDKSAKTTHSFLAIMRYYFPTAWHSVRLVRDKKSYSNAHTHTNKHFWQSLRSTIRTLSQAKSKIRTEKIDENRKPLQLQDPPIR